MNKYTLKGCVTSPYHNHFTFYINRFDIKNVPNEIINEKIMIQKNLIICLWKLNH